MENLEPKNVEADDQHEILVRTYAGLEEVLEGEVRKLGGADVERIVRGVVCTGDKGFLYKLNLSLRTGLRVLKPIKKFRFKSNDDFYKEIEAIDWPSLFDVDKTMIIDSLLFSELFKNSMFVSQLAKDAICDRFRKEVGRRPFIDSKEPHIYVSVYVRDTECTIYLDSSGESLHRRGYRKEQVKAPLSEVMAAGIIMMSGWSYHFPLIDPMCGSGTFSIEAALIANNIPPGIFRQGFAFEHWKDFDQGLFDTILESLNKRITENPVDIQASDRSYGAVELARENAREAGVEGDIRFDPKPFDKQQNPGKKAFLFLNPPYGERMQPEDIDALYGMIGSTLKHTFGGCEAWLFTSNQEALNKVGLRPSRKIKLFNGPLECRLVRFEMYDGSKKASKNNFG
jgi:putative N6-adenine-specific DNA methylase